MASTPDTVKLREVRNLAHELYDQCTYIYLLERNVVIKDRIDESKAMILTRHTSSLQPLFGSSEMRSRKLERSLMKPELWDQTT